MPSLVIGYNVAGTGDVATQFLRVAKEVHERHSAPCTLYVLDKTVEAHSDELRDIAAGPLFDVQMTLADPLKTICQVAEGVTTVWLGTTPAEADERIGAAKQTLAEKIGVDATGLSSPMGYYRGLQDRPDILEVLAKHGILFCRTFGRNEADWQPVPFSVEPFWYTRQGFPEIAEFPSQGWQNALIRDIYGWEEMDGYGEYLKTDLDEAARREDQVWSYWVDDWSAMREDSSMSIISKLLDHASEAELDVVSQEQAYRCLPRETLDDDGDVSVAESN
jgi:hypothetical protein